MNSQGCSAKNAGLPLANMKILELCVMWAGPTACGFLSDFGADVIKVESCRFPDLVRGEAGGFFPNEDPGERPWNRSGTFIERNRNKQGITLDLTVPRGKEIFRELVKISDGLIVNFSLNGIQKLGLDYETIRKVNPSIVMVAITGPGTTGPDKNQRSVGNTADSAGGLTALTGYPDRMIDFSTWAFSDPLSGFMGAAAFLSGMRYRRKTGRGIFIDLSQYELMSSVIGEFFMDFSMNKRVHQPSGNRDTSMAPHGCYRCKGDDRWVTVAVGSDVEWQALCQVLGRQDLADDSRFADVLGRWHNQETLDKEIEKWSILYSPLEVMNKLQAAGVPSGAVSNVVDIANDPDLKARDWFHVYEQPGEVGPYPYRRSPVVLSKTPFYVTKPAPKLGEDNSYVLSKYLGMSAESIEELEREGVIGTVPTSRHPRS